MLNKLISIFKSPTVCPLHNVTLIEGKVPIVYGCVEFTKEEKRRTKILYPYANAYILGGCCEREEKESEIKYCPKCREEYSKHNHERVINSQE
jgi:hypothetical protein